MDPSSGFKEELISEFNKKYTGILLVIKPNGNIVNYKSNNVIKRQLVEVVNKNKKIIINIVLLNIIFLVLSIITSFYINIVSSSNNPIIYLLIFIVLDIIKNIISYITYIKTLNLNEIVTYKLISKFFIYILNLPLSYVRIKDNNEIINRMYELEGIKEYITETITTILMNVILIIPIAVTLILINKINIFLILFYSVVHLIIYKKSSKLIKDISKSYIEKRNDYQSEIIDSISNIISINHTNNIKYFIHKFNLKLKSTTKENNKLNQTLKYYGNIQKITQNIIYLIIITYNLFYIKNTNNYEIIIVTNLLYNILLSNLEELFNTIETYSYIRTLIIKVNELYDIDKKNIGNLEFKKGDILINNLSFSYNKYNNIINSLTLKIKENEHIILKGRSGCGKSTLSRLLNKEYIDYEGLIKIGDKNLKNISLEEIRKNIYYSSQDESLIKGTIRENILMGSDVSKDYFKKVCSMCSLDEFVSKKYFQYDTFLYGGEKDVSGGEKARILLARALIQNRSILILDETLSSLNKELESTIINKVFSYFNKTTIIYITHKNDINYNAKIMYI